MSEQPIPVKIVLIGDGFVGKTSILISYVKDQFRSDYQPTIFDTYAAVVKVGKHRVNLGLWDTAGQEQYQSLRLLSYTNVDAFLIVFSVVDRNSFINAYQKWYPELQKINKNALKVFVGNKTDIRTNGSITYQEAEKTLVKQLNKAQYFQCSALTQDGLKNVFDAVMKIVIDEKISNQKSTIKSSKNRSKGKFDKCCSIF